jgi:dolichol kinase
MNMKGEIKRKSLHLAAAAVPVTLDDNLFAPLFITLIVYVTGGHPAFLSGARL